VSGLPAKVVRLNLYKLIPDFECFLVASRGLFRMRLTYSAIVV